MTATEMVAVQETAGRSQEKTDINSRPATQVDGIKPPATAQRTSKPDPNKGMAGFSTGAVGALSQSKLRGRGKLDCEHNVRSTFAPKIQ